MSIQTIQWNERPPASCQRGAVTIGNFDGVHRGHAALVQAARARAKRVAGPAVVITFHPHPLELLRPGHNPPALTTPNERTRLLQELGADEVLVIAAVPALLQLSAEEFFTRVIEQGCAARAVVEGGNFGFGRQREGNAATLRQLCAQANINCEIVAPILVNDVEVSSSRVRAALLAGHVEMAASLLGRRYAIEGSVVPGQRRGGSLGFPTANLAAVQTLVPSDGVYAARVTVGETKRVAAVNIGPNPTFREESRKVEVHLLDFTGDLYGQAMRVEFVRRLRETRTFPGPAALIEQLRHDVQTAREAVAEPES